MTPVDVTGKEFRALFDAVSTWGPRGVDGQRGALRHLTSARKAAAARLVELGVTVSLGRPLVTEARLDVPQPADHHMTMLTDVDIGSGSVRFAKDYVGVDYHNEGHSHIDALCHVAFDGFSGVADRLRVPTPTAYPQAAAPSATSTTARQNVVTGVAV